MALNAAYNRTAQVVPVPAPVGGWDVKSALADMPEDRARILDNWFPGVGRVSIRPGYTSYATGMTGNVQTLAELIAGGTRKLIAAANNTLWDISSSGAATSLQASQTNDIWSTTNMDGKMALVNGADAPKSYDGSTVSDLTISGSGLTVTTLIGCNTFSGRSYFWADDVQDFWYSAVNTLGGTLTKFPLSRVGQFGGKLVAMGNWTFDAGDGPDDFAVFMMSSGDTIVYQGTDPGSFTLVGVFRLGAPVSGRCMVKMGGDLIAITADGYISMAGALNQGRLTERGILSDQINPAVTDAVIQAGTNPGWQAFHYPRGNMLIFNVPISTSTFQQHVFNTNTGAPCRFKNIAAHSWSLYNDKAYFGGVGVVYLFDSGYFDDGANIDADGLTATTYLGNQGIQKNVTAMQIITGSDGDVAVGLAVGADFETPTVGYETPVFVGGGSDWDTATWDTATWSSGGLTSKEWRNIQGFGYNFSARVRVRTKGQLIKWYSTNYMTNSGGLV